MWAQIVLSAMIVPLVVGMVAAYTIRTNSTSQTGKINKEKDSIKMNKMKERNIRTSDTADNASQTDHIDAEREIRVNVQDDLNDDEFKSIFALDCTDMFYEIHNRVHMLQYKLHLISMIQIAIVILFLAFLGFVTVQNENH